MARGKSQGRIEPRFGGPSGGDDLSVGDEDRLVPQRRSKSPRKQASSRREPRSEEKPGRRGSGRKRRASRGLMGFAGRGVYWMLVLGLWAGIAGAGLVAFYGAQMPSATTWAIPDRPPNVKIMANDGTLLANRGMTGGEAVGLHEMSPFIPQAVVAIEDRRFFSHFGIDPLGLARAVFENVFEGRVIQGGSTLTQQLAKNLFLKPERTLERKVQEVLLALWLEQKHSKDQILEMYLNRVYFGSGAFGVEAASRRYFGKSARDVSLSEAALLAGLLKAPSRLSPARDPKAAAARTELVLAAMRRDGVIGEREMVVALGSPASRVASYWTGSENYVADRVMEELPDLLGEVQADVVVETTVDATLQKLAEKSVRRLIAEEGKALAVSQGALVSIDNSGAVRAMVGGRDYSSSQFDRVSEARRQPGSAFKPFVFLAALEQGMTPESIRNDAPVKIGGWSPGNYKGKFYGPVTLTEALAKSLNSVAAQLTAEVGPKTVVDVAHRMGIQSKLSANGSIALGTSEVTPLELTAAYVPFANGGYRPDIHFVERITSASGKVLYDRGRGAYTRVLRPDVVGMMNAMMSRTVEAGTARKAGFGWPAAGKTGTSQESRDAWFVGYTSNLTTGVWFGNDDGRPTRNITGGSLPVEAWHEFMAAAHKGVAVAALPGGWTPIHGERIDRASGELVPGKRPAMPLGEAAIFQPQPGEGTPAPVPTAGAPRPKAGVGEEKQGRSILDLIKSGGGLF